MTAVSCMYLSALLAGLLLMLCACGEQKELEGGRTPLSVVVFPTHDEPLPTDWGLGHIAGELVMQDGCPRVRGETGPASPNDSRLSFMLVWPKGFTLNGQSVRDREGAVVGSVGDNLRVSVRGVRGDSDLGRKITQGISGDCASGSYFLVGDDVSIIGLDEPVVVSIPGSSLQFQRRKTVATGLGYPRFINTADDYRRPGELVLERDCLLISYQEGIPPGHPEKKYAIVWPPGFHPYVGSGGQVEVRNGGRRTVARVGDWLRFRGGDSTVGDMSKCNMTLFYVKQLLNMSMPLVFPQHNADEWYGYIIRAPRHIKGLMESRNGCFQVQGQTLIWASDFAVRGIAGSSQVIDGTGNLVALQGEVVELAGRAVAAGDDVGWYIRQSVPVDCHSPNFWIVRG